MIDLTNKIYTDKDAARTHLEKIRWPNGPSCPHCGESDQLKALHGKSHRPGLYKCYSCSGNFSVTVGTVFERSKIPLNKWILAVHLMASSKKGISSHQLHRQLGVTYKTAWFMTHRIREAMRDTSGSLLGSDGGTVEIDETFIGYDQNKANAKSIKGPSAKLKVLSLVDRESGRSRSVVVETLKRKELWPIIEKNLSREANIMTDEASYYFGLGLGFRSHGWVNHSNNEYVSKENPKVHTNTIEGYFSIFKRGMKGTYQHCGQKHLHRYLSEFDFRYSFRQKLGYNDAERADIILKGIEGKRLTYS